MSYPGAKSQDGVYQLIIGQMLPHRTYVEAFCGEGWVYRHKLPAEQSILIDLSPSSWLTMEGQKPACIVRFDDALKVLPELDLDDSALVYCDPPYLMSERAGRIYYRHEFYLREHRRLLKILRGLKCMVLLSGLPSQLYREELFDWRCVRYTARTRGKTYTECLWANYAEPCRFLHDWRYAGKNFRQRQAFRRLADRWLARLEAMDARKQGYLLHRLQERYDWRRGPASARLTSGAAGGAAVRSGANGDGIRSP